MNTREYEMYNILKDAKSKYNFKGIKISFEDEGLTGELAQIISSVAHRAGVSVTIKIGGCEAKRDMHDAKVIGADCIVAPMIETPYALKKFVQATHAVFSDDERAYTKFVANVETMTGYQHLPEMAKLPECKELSGFVLGRVDMSGSMGRGREFVNSDEMLNMAQNMAKIVGDQRKKMCIGGGVSLSSLDFFRKLPKDVLEGFETRNIIFDAQAALNNPNIDMGLTQAMGFELAWMERKKQFYGRIADSELERIDMIRSRYQKAMADIKTHKK